MIRTPALYTSAPGTMILIREGGRQRARLGSAVEMPIFSDTCGIIRLTLLILEGQPLLLPGLLLEVS